MRQLPIRDRGHSPPSSESLCGMNNAAILLPVQAGKAVMATTAKMKIARLAKIAPKIVPAIAATRALSIGLKRALVCERKYPTATGLKKITHPLSHASHSGKRAASHGTTNE